MAEISNERIVAAHELQAYQRLVLPRKETVGKQELAVNNAGNLLVKDAAGVTQVIGATVVPPTPGLAAVAAADLTDIGRSFNCTGSIGGAAFVGPFGTFGTQVTTPLITTTGGSSASITLNPDGTRVILGQDVLLSGSAPSSAVTVTTTAPNTTLAVDAGSNATCGTVSILTGDPLTTNSFDIIVPRKNSSLDDVILFLTVQDGGSVAYDDLYVTSGGVTYQATTMTYKVWFVSQPGNTRRVAYLAVHRD